MNADVLGLCAALSLPALLFTAQPHHLTLHSRACSYCVLSPHLDQDLQQYLLHLK